MITPASAPTGEAREYYRWVDENGVVNFSEEVPPGDVDQLRKIILEDPQSDPGLADDPFNIDATAERTQAYRDDLWERRDQARKDRMELERIAAQQRVVHFHQGGRHVPNWYARPPVYPRPPIARPPVRPEPEPPYSVPFRPPGRISK